MDHILFNLKFFKMKLFAYGLICIFSSAFNPYFIFLINTLLSFELGMLIAISNLFYVIAEALVTLFFKIKNEVSDFKLWRKERSEHPEEFELVQRLFDVMKSEAYVTLYVSTSFQFMTRLEIMEEEKKDYSEYKYTLFDHYVWVTNEFNLLYDEVLEYLVVDYYEKYGAELIVDIDKVQEFYKTSMYWNQNKDDYLVSLKIVFDNSKIKAELEVKIN